MFLSLHAGDGIAKQRMKMLQEDNTPKDAKSRNEPHFKEKYHYCNNLAAADIVGQLPTIAIVTDNWDPALMHPQSTLPGLSHDHSYCNHEILGAGPSSPIVQPERERIPLSKPHVSQIRTKHCKKIHIKQSQHQVTRYKPTHCNIRSYHKLTYIHLYI